jgi:hypothetical protein
MPRITPVSKKAGFCHVSRAGADAGGRPVEENHGSVVWRTAGLSDPVEMKSAAMRGFCFGRGAVADAERGLVGGGARCNGRPGSRIGAGARKP